MWLSYMISKKLSYPKTTTISYLNLELINKNFEKEKILNSMDMKYLLFLSAALFIISIGSVYKQKEKHPDSLIVNSEIGKIKLFLLILLATIMLIITANTILDFKWYWNLIILFIMYVFTSDILVRIYSSLFGYKSRPLMSLAAGGRIRHNIYIIDAVITFAIGFILFVIAKLMCF